MANASQRSCCGEIDLSHLGACMHCLVLAGVLTALSWTAFLLFRSNFDGPWISAALLLFSCLFSLLLLAHVIASVSRRKAGNSDAEARVHEGKPSHPQ